MYDEFPQRMHAVRTHLGMSIPALSAQVGLKDRSTWNRYENGTTRPNSDTLAALYDLGIDINWLLSGEGTMLRGHLLPVAEGSGAGSAYTQDDRLYEIAVKATLRWYSDAGMDLAPDGLAGMISRAVRMLRGRGDAPTKTDAELGEEVASILDVARDMLTSGGWKPKSS